MKGEAVAVAGASGTIGRAVVRECVARGFEVIALVRHASDRDVPELAGARVQTVNLADPTDVALALAETNADVVISCIASRSGSPKDALKVDYEANCHLLRAGEGAGVQHFILLSAICVQKPKLAFQRAKLGFETELRTSRIAHTIIRPTAFFKSLSGQVERVRAGKPFFLFGDGELTACKPISDGDLARFIANQVGNEKAYGAILPIGGPGPAITLKRQGELLFEAAGLEPKFRSVPVGVFRLFAAIFSLGAWASDWLAEKAEYARIARYYATESMLVLDPVTGQYCAEATPEFGEDQLIDHYRAILADPPK
ncbi:NAD(P)H-binding protein [Erythrobacter sp. SCSIO 43205]|uniref:NAD(P)H-binding protein n=1 Tax=Erythrobacter sp. SCSIO 43205 TaxID=2779361 RepID=UPI001CA85D21|nr:NAD(P)H-binding protein [Erythrobacter sp. SCSIO 43205]UAB78082.1 NAD(P)H-binding protein [Erythrobacter sp. SCSIO 43205]